MSQQAMQQTSQPSKPLPPPIRFPPTSTSGASESAYAAGLVATTGARSAARMRAGAPPPAAAAARAAWRSWWAAQSSGVQQRDRGTSCSCIVTLLGMQGNEQPHKGCQRRQRGSKLRLRLSRASNKALGDVREQPERASPAHLVRRWAGRGHLRQRSEEGLLAVSLPRRSDFRLCLGLRLLLLLPGSRGCLAAGPCARSQLPAVDGG